MKNHRKVHIFATHYNLTHRIMKKLTTKGIIAILSIICTFAVISCEENNESSLNIEDASFNLTREMVAGTQLKIDIRLYDEGGTLDNATVRIGEAEIPATIHQDNTSGNYFLSCHVPEDLQGKYTLSLILNSQPVSVGEISIFQLGMQHLSTDTPVSIDINGAYLLIGSGKLTASAIEKVIIKDMQGDTIPGEMKTAVNISEKYTFVQLEHAHSFDTLLPDNGTYVAIPQYNYQTSGYVVRNSDGLLIPLYEPEVFGLRSLSDTRFCFLPKYDFDNTALCVSEILEENLPASISNQEDLERLSNCIHTLDLRNTEGKLDWKHFGSYGLEGYEDSEFHEAFIYLNKDQIYAGNNVINMSGLVESNAESIEKIFSTRSGIMAITITNRYFRLYLANPNDRAWEKIGEWDRNVGTDDAKVATQGDRAIIITNNNEYRIAENGTVTAYPLTWKTTHNIYNIEIDPILQETGNFLYFSDRSELYRSRIEGTMLQEPENLGEINGTIFHNIDDILVTSFGSTEELNNRFRIIVNGQTLLVTDSQHLTDSHTDYLSGAILNPGV